MSKNTKALNYQTDPLTVINRIVDALSRSSTVDQVLQDVLKAIQNYTSADMLTLLVANQESTSLELRASQDLVDEVIHQGPTSIENSLSGLTIIRQEIITSADIANDQRIKQDAREALSKHGLNYIISMPIMFQGKAIAVTNLFYRNMPEIPDRAHETLLAIGKLLGSALANTGPTNQLNEKNVQEIVEFKKAEEIAQTKEAALLEFQDKLNILQDVNFQLARLGTLSELYKQAVVLGRSHLGFDRIGLLLYDQETETMFGTFGTDNAGELRDEQYFSQVVDNKEILEVIAQKKPFKVWETAELRDDGKAVGTGWNAMAVLWYEDQPLGWIAADNFLKKEPLSQNLMELMRLYAITIAHLIVRQRSEDRSRQQEEIARAFQKKLQALQEISIELGSTETLDELYRRAIELGKEKLGFDRLGLLLHDEKTNHMRGTYGINAQGDVVDERAIDQKIDRVYRQILTTKERFTLLEGVPLYEAGKAMGTGWNAIAAIWNGDKGIGWLATDNMISQAPPEQHQLDLLSLYGNVLGYLSSQKQTENTLQERENLLQLVLNTIPQAVFWKDNNLVFLGSNQNFAEDVGLKNPEELIGKTDYDFGGKEEEVEFFRAVDRRVMDADKPELNIIEPLSKADGKQAWLATNKVPLHDDTGNVIGILGTYEDITERLEADLKLRERENLLKIVLDTIPQAVFWKDKDSTYLGGNTNFAHDFGFDSSEALIGKTDFDGPNTEEEIEFFHMVDRRVMDSGKPELNIIEPQSRADGTVAWLSTNKVPLHDTSGEVIGILGTYQDITERRQAEVELQRREEEYRELYIDAPVAYMTLSQQGIIEQANKKAAEILQLDLPKLLGRSLRDFFADSPDGMGKVEGMTQKLLNGEDLRYEQFEFVTAKGKNLWLSLSIYRVQNENNEFVAARATATDITEQKRAEDALRNNEATLRKQNERLIELAKSKAINSGDMGKVFRTITETAVDIIDVARASIWLYEAERITLVDLFEIEPPTHSDGLILEEIDYPAYFNALVKEGTIVANDAHRNARTKEFSEHYLMPLGISSILDTTAQIGGETKAILRLEHIGTRRHWSIEEQNFANSLSDLLALAIEANDRQNLEAKLQESLNRREQEVRLSTQIAQEIAAATDLNDLYHRVVTQIHELFGYYYTQLLRYDPALDLIGLIEGYGDVGKQMRELNHSVPFGVGIIGTSASRGTSVLRPDVRTDPTWQPNPLLPYTKGELAVPIKLRDEVLGVLDVQSDEVNALDENDLLVLEGLCGQIAIAIESTMLRQDMESRLRELNALQRQMSREGWLQYQATRENIIGYQYDHSGVQPLVAPSLPAKKANGHRKAQTLNTEVFDTPLTVRGERIGLFGIENDPERPLTDDDHKFLDAITREIAEALESARLFEQTQTALNEQERLTSELETVAQVSTAASTILEIDALLQSVVDLAKTSFHLYHAHIYLVNENETRMILKAGAGNIGRLMTLEGREIGINAESLVARAARTRQGVMSNNVRKTIDYLPHPLLPKTESELAVPMIVGDKLVGIMDLQSDKPNFFTDDDLKIQRTLASQIAIAVENALQYAEQVQTAVKLRELDQLKSEFLASMSHELRTPLNSIIGFADVLLEGLDGELNERMEEDVRLIRQSGRHLRDLIGDILDMSKIESGRMELRYEEIDMPQFARDIVATASSLANEKNLYLNLDIGENVSIIQADRTRLRQILWNITGNAIKFTEKGGVTLAMHHREEHIVVSIRDTGIGIKDESIGVVFEQFRQIDGGLNRIAGGTGLGMPITKKLVELHGGEIWIESVYGQGSTFLFTIPYDTSKRRDQLDDIEDGSGI